MYLYAVNFLNEGKQANKKLSEIKKNWKFKSQNKKKWS